MSVLYIAVDNKVSILSVHIYLPYAVLKLNRWAWIRRKTEEKLTRLLIR